MLRVFLSVLIASAWLGLSACSETKAGCRAQATACIDGQPSTVLVCSEDGWQGQACPADQLCFEGACKVLACLPAAKGCLEGKVVTCSTDGSVWSAPASCPANEACSDGEGCRPVICAPGTTRCGSTANTAERCDSSGTAWEVAGQCASAEVCVEGTCLDAACTAGERACGQGVAFTCEASHWQATACGSGTSCAFGQCVQCLVDEHCVLGSRCEAGVCVETAPVIVTTTLLPATVNVPYTVHLLVEGGLPPYSFFLTTGTLPAGLMLDPDGVIAGSPTGASTSTFTVEVMDARNAKDTQVLTLDVLSAGELRVTTASLPVADLDYPYSIDLTAAGGVPPYAWQSLQPLPAGLALGSNGRIEGTPSALGSFPITIRVLDVRTPPGYAAKDFTLTVRIAPLEIVGGQQEINLFVTKILTLPLIVPYLPYSENLQARGGLKPYTWTMQPPPNIPFSPITQWGLPNGLTMTPEGKISGSITDTSTATTVSIPFANINLTGYFIYARVTDSQPTPVWKEAIFFIPTVAL